MEVSLLKLTLLVTLLLASLYTNSAWDDFEEEEEYILDNRSSSTFLRRILKDKIKDKIKKGTTCDAKYNNLCNGISANNGTSILYCCKKHCRNVLGDRNNCGVCGHKCEQTQRCCGGECTNVFTNPYNCGKCDKACSSGVQCENGFCGYA